MFIPQCADSGSESGKWYTNVSIVGDNGLVKKKESLEKTLVKKQKSLENILEHKKKSPEKIPIGFNDGQHDLKKPLVKKKTLVKKQQSLENILDNKKQSPEKIPIGFNDGQHDLKKPSPDKVETKKHGQKLTKQKLHDLKLSVRYVQIVIDIAAVLMLTVTITVDAWP